jgi:hypothetical protein
MLRCSGTATDMNTKVSPCFQLPFECESELVVILLSARGYQFGLHIACKNLLSYEITFFKPMRGFTSFCYSLFGFMCMNISYFILLLC